MHSHGYLWRGEKERFDREMLRRPAPGVAPGPGCDPGVLARYREAVTDFPLTDLPPIEVAYWLVKPPRLVCETFDEPRKALRWLSEQFREHQPRLFVPEGGRLPDVQLRLRYADSTLGWGGDVVWGDYLGQSQYLHVAVISCPNRAKPQLPCPARTGG
ncbi:hypothetical protein [Streptomyces formicae]